jgi:hypothetical protein
MPRCPHPAPDWGTLEIGYRDEFGSIATDVYAAAGRVWGRARDYAARVLHDFDDARARTMPLRAAAQVTRARDEKSREISALDAYLFQTFRRVVLAELEKDDNRHRLESEACYVAEWDAQASNVAPDIARGDRRHDGRVDALSLRVADA